MAAPGRLDETYRSSQTKATNTGERIMATGRITGGCLGLLALIATPALAAAPVQQAVPAIPGWDRLVDGLRTMPDAVLAKLPPEMRADPQIRAEVGRLMIEALASSSLEALGADVDHPVFLPLYNQVLNVGQVNSDTIYRIARVAPDGVYRLRGRRGSARIAMIGQMGPFPYETGNKALIAGGAAGYQSINALPVDANGQFDVMLSAKRPGGYTGPWWPLLPTTNKLLMRMVGSDWAKERDPAVSIERVDRPVTRPRTSAAELQARLERLPVQTGFIAMLLMNRGINLRNEGYINKLKVMDMAQNGGLVGQFYYEGAYELTDNEALIVEAKVPAKCHYSSILLTNAIYETTDWTNNHSSLNDSQARPDADGVLRVVVAAKDPGVANWLDTAGYPQGVVQGRWMDCDSQPVPSVRKVALADVRKSLPPGTRLVTPAERDRIIRDRRAAFQQRPLW
jgi:hypothetical protein